jgi:hypothetical protein
VVAVGVFFFTLLGATLTALAGHEYGNRIGDTRGILGYVLGLLFLFGGLAFAVATL